MELEGEIGTQVPSYTSELGTRISKVIGRLGGIRAASTFIGASEDSLANWRNGRSRPSFYGMQGLATAANVSLDWLATGEGPMRRDEHFHDKGSVNRLEQEGQASVVGLGTDGFVMVPKYDVEASAGHGSFNDIEHIVDYMAFREEWVRRTLRIDPKNLVLITAIGDSMEPAIRAGDLLLIDTGVGRVIDDAIYVLTIHDGLVVKRVQQFFNGAVAIKSDNAAYTDETLSPEEVGDIVIAGRVRWIGRLI